MIPGINKDEAISGIGNVHIGGTGYSWLLEQYDHVA